MLNKVFYKDAQNMSEVPDNTVNLIVTSPPYFNIKDYAKDGYQKNTNEFITIYVKVGMPINNLPAKVKEASKLSEKEWVKFTKQIWQIPIPTKNDAAFGNHSAIMPEEIVYRCVRLFTYIGDIVLDPFTGSGTTLKTA